MKATVIYKEDNKIYVMTEDGQFKYVKNKQNAQIGDNIYLNSYNLNYKKIFTAFIAASLIFAIILTVININIPKVYAYVYVDINPSLQITINKNGKIIDVISLNKDGNTLLKNMHFKGENIETFITKVVKDSENLGYLKDNNTVVITTINIKNSKTIQNDINKAIENLKSDIKSINIEVLETDKSQLEQAKKINTSPGRLILWEKAQREGINIPKDKLNNKEFFEKLKKSTEQSQKDKLQTNNKENTKNVKQNNTNEKINKLTDNKNQKSSINIDNKNPVTNSSNTSKNESKNINEKQTDKSKNISTKEKPITPAENIQSKKEIEKSQKTEEKDKIKIQKDNTDEDTSDKTENIKNSKNSIETKQNIPPKNKNNE
ncbi:MAG: anti-sigma-I factor RsgI family protein [Thermoanaerobacteraceae bacterium]